jgi:capsular polysaccharide export protein
MIADPEKQPPPQPGLGAAAATDHLGGNPATALPDRLYLGSRGAIGTPGFSDRLQALLRPSYLVSDPGLASAILAWGRKPSSLKAAATASRHGLPLWRMEDAFLRSVRPGHAEPPLGLVFDDLGIYYDASRESRLEKLISRPLDRYQESRAADLIRLWRQRRISKYNHAPDRDELLPSDFVLVVDQTCGDLSICYGLANEHSFARMLECALLENPDLPVVLKLHPEVANGTKKGHFTSRDLQRLPCVILIGDEVHPVGLLEKARKVYTVTSQVGFEALLHGKRVRTFGMPFYSGWGLTEDELSAPSRRGSATLHQLAHAALIDYARYIDDCTGGLCEAEQVIEYLGTHRRKVRPASYSAARRHPSSAGHAPNVVYAVGFELWKRSPLRTFLPGKKLVYERSPRTIPRHNKVEIATWGSRFADADFPEGSSITRYEDGFIRSTGLGVRFAPAISWIRDNRGIYYDATRPSDLEEILQHEEFDPTLLQRARRLREQVVRAGLTKYNLPGPKWQRPARAKRVVLVPGQVESDASITLGTRNVQTNRALLESVRTANPDAYLLYKPHPDVVAGLRKRGDGEGAAAALCDAVVTAAPMHELLEAADEVHVMTSLTGFEALLRGKRVVVYGQPFYAGWGLTTDLDPPERRTRRLELDELVAGALIRYPVYRSPSTSKTCEAEEAVDELGRGRGALSRGALESTLRMLQYFPLWSRLLAR